MAVLWLHGSYALHCTLVFSSHQVANSNLICSQATCIVSMLAMYGDCSKHTLISKPHVLAKNIGLESSVDLAVVLWDDFGTQNSQNADPLQFKRKVLQACKSATVHPASHYGKAMTEQRNKHGIFGASLSRKAQEICLEARELRSMSSRWISMQLLPIMFQSIDADHPLMAFILLWQPIKF